MQLECIYRKLSTKAKNEEYMKLIFVFKYVPIYIHGNMCICTYIHFSEKLGISSDHFKLVLFIFFFILFIYCFVVIYMIYF